MNTFKKIIPQTLLVLMFAACTSGLFAQPADWAFTISSQNHTVVIPNTSSLSIGGQAIPTGSFIGAFYEDQGQLTCAGYVEWTGQTTSLAVMGGDSANQGYQPGDTFIFKIWLPDSCIIQTTLANFLTGGIFSNTNTYAPNGISGLAVLNGIRITASIQAPSVLCEGETGRVSADISHGAGPYSYSWNNTPPQPIAFVNLPPGTHELRVTDQNGCEVSEQINIGQTPTPQPPQGISDSVCLGEAATLTANGSNIRWYTVSLGLLDSGSTYQTAPLTQTQLFKVTQTVDGCESVPQTLEVSVFALPNVSFQAIDPLCENEDNLLLTTGSPAGGTYQTASGIITEVSPSIWGTGNFPITYIYTDPNGCSDSSTQTLTIDPKPAKPEILQGTGDSLYASIQGDSYQWLLNGQLLQGSAREILASDPGSYQLVITEGNCHSDTSDFFVVAPTHNGPFAESGIKVFPIPAKEVVNILVPSYMGTIRAGLYDLQGRRLAQKNGQHELKFELELLPPGIYIIRIESATTTHSKRLVIH